jgi:hypothetical protein
MKVTKWYCDVCGEEYTPSDYPPWYPEYCPKHMEEYLKHAREFATYVSSSDASKNPPRTWLSSEPSSSFKVGGHYKCVSCGRMHPPGPCENFTGYPLWR